MNVNQKYVIWTLLDELTRQGFEIVLFPQCSDLIDNPEEILETLQASHETELHVYKRRPDRTYSHFGTIDLTWPGQDLPALRNLSPRLVGHVPKTQQEVARLRASALASH
jgi:hypothetical protein